MTEQPSSIHSHQHDDRRDDRFKSGQELETTHGHLGTAERLERIWKAANSRQRDLMVVMEDVYIPHNLAAIARTCDVFGVQQIAFTLENHKYFDPRHVGKIASSSASKWVDYRIFHDGTQNCLNTLKGEGYHILGLMVDENAQSLYGLNLTQHDRLAVMVGNEHKGLSPAAQQYADTQVVIPMRGIIESLNVSVATAILLSEITRQREKSGKDYRISEADAFALFENFLRR